MLDSDIVCRAIGRVLSPVSGPRDRDWGEVQSDIELLPEFRRGLVGLGDFSHILVVTFMHGARYEEARHLIRRPQERDDMPEVGIFAQRAKYRPNPIGVTAVRLLSVSSDGVTVRGLDAIDGTPVLDIKPYYPQYDSPAEVHVPEWVGRLMRGYF